MVIWGEIIPGRGKVLREQEMPGVLRFNKEASIATEELTKQDREDPGKRGRQEGAK